MPILSQALRTGALTLLLLASPLSAAGGQEPLPLMPYPQHIEYHSGRWVLPANGTVALAAVDDPRIEAALARFSQRFERQFHRAIQWAPDGHTCHTLEILLTREPDPRAPDETLTLDRLTPEREAYRLTITETRIRLEAASYQGINHGLETLLQLFGHQSEHDPEALVSLPQLVIKDAPRFRWRGLMIDSVRHFFSVETLKRQLDAMAAAKLNIFHWHLTDDQGWRLESRHYPKLHEKASDGLYYTREEVRDIVAYALARGIQVVPEIDMPGHSSAIGVAYPELMAAPGPYEMEDRWGVHTPLLNPINDDVYVFADRIFSELVELFPFEYVHIGGDEVDPRDWLANEDIVAFMAREGLDTPQDLHNHFNQRMAKILAQHDRRLIGWDEILHPDLPEGAAVQSWRGPDSMGEIANQGHPAILSTGFYLDMPQYTGYHYRNPIFPRAPETDVEPGADEHWESWTFTLPRKRGAPITGSLTLIRDSDDQWRGVIDFSGRSREDLHNVEQVGDILYFDVDTWAGPVLGRIERRGDRLGGDMVFGNAPYAASGELIAGSDLPDTRIPEPLPTPQIAEDKKAFVLGGEAALWSEIVDERHIDLRLWPRTFAVAERLWSSAEMTDEADMYRRLAVVDDWAEQSLKLHHRQQSKTALEKLLPAAQIPGAGRLLVALEPAHYYHRHHEKSAYGTYSRRDPLDRLVDTLPVESSATRELAQQLAGGPTEQRAARDTLTQWRDNAQTLLAQLQREGDPGKLADEARRVHTTAEWGLLLLELRAQNRPLEPSLVRAARVQLRAAQQIHAEIVVPAAYPIERLLDTLPAARTDYMPEGSFTDGIEGPAFGPDGRLYVPNLKTQGTIGVVSAPGQAEVFMHLPEGSIGNAIRFNADGDMLIADYTGNNVHVVDLETREIRHTYHQSAMHQPNDIAVARSGTIYASDPDWATDSGQLWRISPDGTITLLEGDMGTTNGIELSPDETRLYVNESVQRRVWVYNVSPEGELSNKRLFHQFDDYGLDGMKTDRAGNLYIARYGAGRITVLSPEGDVINRFALRGQYPTNLALDEGETLRVYVTLQQRGAIETFIAE